MLNKKAQSFSLKDKDAKAHNLKDINSDFTVLYFYPKDNTSGCTIQANTFNSKLPEFKKLKTTIIAISGGDEKSKTKFCEKNNLKIILLSDTDFNISKKYNVYGEKKFMGKTYDGIYRTTFVLDKNKKIIKIFEKVKPAENPDEIIGFIRSQMK